MRAKNFAYRFLILIVFCCFGYSSVAQKDSLMIVLEHELEREFRVLSKASIPAYYLHYDVHHVEYITMAASFGSIIQSTVNKNRVLTTQVRVGNYAFDNSHPASSRQAGYVPQQIGLGPVMLPIENNELALEAGLWQATQNEYKQALESFKAIRNNSTKRDSAAQKFDDFSKEKPETYVEEPIPSISSTVDKKIWEEKIKKYSAPFLRSSDIVEGDVALRFTQERKYFASSEGTRIVQNITSAYINISGSIRADDGDIVPLHLSYYASLPTGLPSDDAVVKQVDELVKLLGELKRAPLAEPYSGPAILLAQTAGVFFHEIFGHRIEGHRLRNEYDGQTFKSKVNEEVLPKTLSVSFDPTTTNVYGQAVNGAYKFDDEGVKSQKVDVVVKGVLKTFLMSRTPLEQVAHSNGHGRAALGAVPVSRQSNLIVDTSKPVSMQELRKMLIKECKKQGKRYGYLFKEVVGGFTVTDRYNPNAFNIFPTVVYRIYADGRPDELVRGVDLIGTPLAMFAEIQAAANDRDVFVGFCGAESGSVPVSASAPSMFVRRIETQKKPRQHQETMLLARPSSSDH